MAKFLVRLTEQGRELLNKEKEIVLTRAVVGSGVYQAQGNCLLLENVASPLEVVETTIKEASVSRASDYIYNFQVDISTENKGLTKHTPIREIGLYVGNTLLAYSWLEGEDTDNILPPPLDINVTDSIHTHQINFDINLRGTPSEYSIYKTFGLKSEASLREGNLREALKGISYLEWTKVKKIIDQTFEHKKTQLERKLQLDDGEKYFCKVF